MEIIAEIGPHFDAVLALAAQASRDYDAFVFDSPAQAAELQRELLRQGASECAAPFCRLLVEEGRLVGIAAALTDKELAACRMRAALVLSGLAFFAAGSSVRNRIRLAASALSHLEDGDYYLSRLTVASEARGRGFGRVLLERVIQDAQSRQCRRVVLDVSSDNTAALHLYSGS
jgi:ribosomal protein S18 acetylase RimI-like enzyme